MYLMIIVLLEQQSASERLSDSTFVGKFRSLLGSRTLRGGRSRYFHPFSWCCRQAGPEEMLRRELAEETRRTGHIEVSPEDLRRRQGVVGSFSVLVTPQKASAVVKIT